ncbi:MAG: manganese efflux pump [Bacteroidales bacterium]|nr:manganese efflux pump [Bacteroidales bacterium]
MTGSSILFSILAGLSLSADCFAVSLCSSVTVDLVRARRKVWKVAAVFAVIQTSFLLAGWGAATLFADWLSLHFDRFSTVARWAGFLLLLYVGGMMILDAVRGETGHFSLSGLRGIILGGVATSIDALSVGISFGLAGQEWTDILPDSISVFIFTALAVVAGMLSGSAAGTRFGSPVRIAGGIILIALGIHILL